MTVKVHATSGLEKPQGNPRLEMLRTLLAIAVMSALVGVASVLVEGLIHG